MMRFHCVPLLAAITASISMLIAPSLCQDSDKTFVGSGSYALYPAWLGLTSNEGTISFTIRTSELSSLLLYAEGNGSMPSDGSTDYIVVTMDNGVIKILLQFFEIQSSTTNTTTVILGEHLNDNRPHTLLIRHSGQTLEYSIDSTEQVNVTYSSTVVSNVGANGIYFGGLPNTVTPILDSVRSEANFVGCLESITASNNSQQVAPVMLLDQNNLRDGCIDPCSAVSCQVGECIARWPDRGFCDCSGTSMSGENCSETPSILQLTNIAYFCYTLKPQPFINDMDTINVQLITPLPSSGTIMTGLSKNGARFALYLKNSQLFYELRNDNMMMLSISSQTLRLDLSYQVSLVRQQGEVEVVVSSIAAPQSEQRFNGTLIAMRFVVFEMVCVGGGLLEVPNYEGIQSNVFFNYFALSEERNFNEFDQTCVSRTDHIYIKPLSAPSSLQFEEQTLVNNRISFEVRTDENAEAGILLFSRNDQFELSVANFNGNILILGTVVGNSSIIVSAVCPVQIVTSHRNPVNNGKFHYIDIERTETRLVCTVDRIVTCSLPDELHVAQILNSLTNEPLQFGATTDGVQQDGAPGEPVPFEGCFQNIEFRRGSDSEPFRPNLEVVINAEERFDAIGCFNCTSDHETEAGCSDDCNCIFTESNQPSCLCPGDGDSCPITNITTTPSLPETTPPMTDVDSSTTTETTLPPSDTDSSTMTETTLPSPDTDSSTTTNQTTKATPSAASLSAGAIAGIVVGVILGILLLIAVIVLLIICVYRSLAFKQGFYETHESNGRDLSMIHYSASLRELSSEVVNVESNGTVGSTRATRQDREFYL